jgi:pyruvate,water dikinase
MSDFKTNEYANLIGGQQFEFQENNPMLGFRGASRYYRDRYREGFALECRALKRVREEMGLANVIVMTPFCRTLKEADRVLQVLGDNGLKRSELADLFDERDEAVTRLIRSLITSAHLAGRKGGICGQASSDYPDFAEFLVS